MYPMMVSRANLMILAPPEVPPFRKRVERVLSGDASPASSVDAVERLRSSSMLEERGGRVPFGRMLVQIVPYGGGVRKTPTPLFSLRRTKRDWIRRTSRAPATADIEGIWRDSREPQSKRLITSVSDPSLPNVLKMSEQHMKDLMDDDPGSNVSIGTPE
jgi:hypothetical protein